MVLHRSGDRAVRAEAGRFLAARIPDARFIEVDGDDHWFWVGDQQPLLDSHQRICTKQLTPLGTIRDTPCAG